MADKGGKKGRGRKILGYVLTGLGILSIVDFFSPIPIPTVGITAIVSGTILVGVGLFTLASLRGDWKVLLRRAFGARKQAEAGAATSSPLDPLVPVAILRLAQERGGTLTIAAAAMALDLPLETAEAGMEECVRRGAATPEYDEKRSTVAYRFPEFLPPPRGEIGQP